MGKRRQRQRDSLLNKFFNDYIIFYFLSYEMCDCDQLTSKNDPKSEKSSWILYTAITHHNSLSWKTLSNNSIKTGFSVPSLWAMNKYFYLDLL